VLDGLVHGCVLCGVVGVSVLVRLLEWFVLYGLVGGSVLDGFV